MSPSTPLQVSVHTTKLNSQEQSVSLLPPGIRLPPPPPGIRLPPPPGIRLPPPPCQRQTRIENSNQELHTKLPKRNVDTIQKSDQSLRLELVASLGNAMKKLDTDATGWDDAEKYQESVSGFWRRLKELRHKKVNNIVFSYALCFLKALKRARARLHSQARKQIKQKQMMMVIREMSCSKRCMLSFITAWKDHVAMLRKHVAMLPELRRLRDKKLKLKTPTSSDYHFTRQEVDELIKYKKAQEEVNNKKINENKEAIAHTLRIRQLEMKHQTKAYNESKSRTGKGDMRLLPPGDSDSESDAEPDEYDAAGNTIIKTPSKTA